jgi:Spy/CpxP family protein refolding chaperone
MLKVKIKALVPNPAEGKTVHTIHTTRRLHKAFGLLFGAALLLGGATAWADTDGTGGPPPYGPGMMWRYQATPGGASGNSPAYGPGMMRGYGAGYRQGPDMMRGYGYGPGIAGWGGPGMMMGCDAYGPGIMGGWGGYGADMMGGYTGWHRAPLNLSDQQRQQLDDIHAKAIKQMWPLMGQMQLERFALARLLGSENPDMKAVDEAYNKLSQSGRKLLDVRIRTHRAIWAVLTAEQRKLLRQGGAPRR